jgi:hypothetical protein
MKICSLCNIRKDYSEFHKHKTGKDGYTSGCKECRKIKSKKDYDKLKQNDKVVITEKTCASCLIQKDVNSFHKQIGTKDGFRSMCKECRKDKFKSDYQNLPEFSKKHKQRTKKYRIENKEKYNNYFKERYKKMPHVYAWRSMLKSVLRRFGTKKEQKTIEMLGYSAEDLKKHIESLFLEGMSWENWGKWEIDHIKPVSSFDKTTDTKIVNDLNNLQPLWKSDNIKKGTKF